MWNKEILMDFRAAFIWILIIGLSACSMNKENTYTSCSEDVTIHVQNAMPHCGGAAPMPYEDYPQMEPFISCALSVHLANDDGSRGKRVGEIVTNESGKAIIKLHNGKYQLWMPSKLESFVEFKEKVAPIKNTNYAYRDDACIEEWYKRVDFEFEVNEKKEFSFAYQNRCFTGAHPCMTYSGPFPP